MLGPVTTTLSRPIDTDAAPLNTDTFVYPLHRPTAGLPAGRPVLRG
jgi:hypothetical protein